MIRYLTKISSAGWVFSCILVLGYAALPSWIIWTGRGTDYGRLPAVALLAAAGVFVGAYAPKERLAWPRLKINLGAFLLLTWIFFFIFATVAIYTADQLPLIAALKGSGSAEVAVLREKFLKARQGWQASFVYINAIFTGALIPYALSLMFVHRTRLRWVMFGLFLVYSLSFIEKAFFLKAALPFLYLVIQKQVKVPFSSKTIILGIFLLLFGVTAISRIGADEISDRGNFYTVSFVPKTPFEHLTWRSIIVPMVTASDALNVFSTDFHDTPLNGRTSSVIAALLGVERIPFERLVFSAQWGQNETGTGSSNSAFFTEAFVNFRWLGVVLFSLASGRILRLMAESDDEAFRSLWMLFCFGLYNSGLIGLLLSNGFVVVLALGLFGRIDTARSGESQNATYHSTSNGQERTNDTRDGRGRLHRLPLGAPSSGERA